jgi:glycyl-tRNA synthetase
MPESTPPAPAKSMDAIMSLCKRRGFVYQASEIYGGINGFWDYGPLGSLLKRNLREAWIQDTVMNPCGGRDGPDGKPVSMVMVDTRIIQHPRVWEASGHVAGFNDPMVDDKETKGRFRADHLQGLYSQKHPLYQGGESEYPSTPGGPPLFMSGKDSIPNLTIVAGTTGEAAQMLVDDKKLRKQLGIRDIKEDAPVQGVHGELHPCFVIDRGLGAETVVIGSAYLPLQSHAQHVPSPFSNKPGALTEPRQFNLMFDTITGAIRDEANKAYLRPETAQGIFVQFKNVIDTNRLRVPFGIAQTGTSFRNEVTPRNFTFRSREFEQMEVEFFVVPPEFLEGPEKEQCGPLDWYRFWRDYRMEWWKAVGLGGDNLILREHEKDELSHYSSATSDIEYRFPFTAPGFGELEGIAYRGNFDLTQHQKHSGAKLEYRDTARGDVLPNGSRRGIAYLPHVIEPSAGLDRGVLALLCEAYTKDESRPSPEFMKFHPRVAPIKAAVFPLVEKDGMPEIAEKLYHQLHKRFSRVGMVEFDEKQSIGKRYARMDEAGCPYCFTIDGQTKEDQTVTVRDRDTGKQDRMALDKVEAFLAEKLNS